MKVMILSSFAAANFYFREDMMKAMIKKGHQVVAGAPEPAEIWNEGARQKSNIQIRKPSKPKFQRMEGRLICASPI